jgi:hypothetical protein
MLIGTANRRGFFINIAKEIVERTVDLDVDVDGNVDRLYFNGFGFDAQAAAKIQNHQDERKDEAALHGVKLISSGQEATHV